MCSHLRTELTLITGENVYRVHHTFRLMRCNLKGKKNEMYDNGFDYDGGGGRNW